MKTVSNLIDQFKNSSFWKSVAALSMGQIIAQGINLFSIPIISRVYSKEAYGDFGILTSTAIIIIGFIGLGLGSAIMAAPDDDEAKKIFRSSFTIQIVLASIFATGLLIAMPHYRFFASGLPYAAAIIVMLIYIVLTVMSSLMSVYVNRLRMTKVLFYNPLIGALSTLFLTLPLGLIGLDTIGLYIANITSLLIINIHMLRKVNPFKTISLKEIVFVIKKYRHFIIYQYPSNLMGTFIGQLPNQLLSRSYGNAALGDYSMCNRIFGVPTSLIATPIQTIYFRTVAAKYRVGEDIAGFTYSLVTKLMLLSFVPIGAIMLFGESIFTFVLGNQWSIAGELAAILALQYLYTFCYSCVTYCRVAIGKQKINLYMSIIQFLVIMTSLYIGVVWFHTLVETITCFAIANALYMIGNLTVNFYCLRKYTFKFILFNVIYCSALLFLVYIKIQVY